MSTNMQSTLNIILGELSSLYKRLEQDKVVGLLDALQSAHSVFMAGAGRSGMLLRCFTMRMMHMGKKAYMVGEVVTPAIRPGDLLLIASGSGETGSLVNMARKAKDIGAKLALVTANPESTITGLADAAIVLAAPTPKAAGIISFVPSAQPMGNLFEQGMFLFLEAVIMELMARTGKTSDSMFKLHANLE